MTRGQWKFLEAEFVQLTMVAMTRTRGGTPVYNRVLSDNERRAVSKTLRGLLRKLSRKYKKGGVSDEDHVRNIEELAFSMQKQYKPLLLNGEFRIGIAQKALNLCLKYRWCLGHIPMPPDCPFDSRILAKINWRGPSWTAINSTKEYQKLVGAARKVAKGSGYTHLAEWELAEYNSTRKL